MSTDSNPPPIKSRPKGRWRSNLQALALIAVAMVLIIAFSLFLVWLPLPMRKASVPSELTQFTPGITAFYRYDLGGFIDTEYLWRIEAPPTTIAAVAHQLKLLPTNTVPSTFYAMSPIGWPDSLPTDAEAFQSKDFLGDARGQDGVHYFLLHDKRQGKAYVWVKQNF